MRSDSLIHADPRAQVLVAPPGTNLADYLSSSPETRGGADGRRGVFGRGRGGRRGKRGGNGRMDVD